jgi:transcriptional regulator with XRE-family HTH domain
MSMRGLARKIGVTDSHLSRAVRNVDYKRASPDLMKRISHALGLPPDYFEEVREAFVIDAIRADPSLRNELYARLLRRRPSSRTRRRT